MPRRRSLKWPITAWWAICSRSYRSWRSCSKTRKALNRRAANTESVLSSAARRLRASSSPTQEKSGLRVQRPEIGEALQGGIALHGLERLAGFVLVAGLQLRDAERQSR